MRVDLPAALCWW